MVYLVADFFGIFGTELMPPTTFATFIPWLLQVFVGIAIIAFVFKFFAAVARSVFGQRWL